MATMTTEGRVVSLRATLFGDRQEAIVEVPVVIAGQSLNLNVSIEAREGMALGDVEKVIIEYQEAR